MVNKYYNNVYSDYEDNYSQDHIHYGFWYDDTRTHEESLNNTVEAVIERLNIRDGDIVLDAGCGSGGSCRYIERKYDVHVVGITLSNVLIDAAVRKSADIMQKGDLHFVMSDYNRTCFKNDTFTKIYGIESVCYSENVSMFASESYRVLSHGGIIGIIDFFKKRNDCNEQETEIYHEWLSGWAMPEILSVNDFIHCLKESGFKSVRFISAEKIIQKSIDIIYDTSASRLFDLMLRNEIEETPEYLIKHLISGCRQKNLFDSNIITYGIITGKKI